MPDDTPEPLELRPIAPDTVASLRQELSQVIRDALREAGQEELISTGQIDWQMQRNFPSEVVVVVTFTLTSALALGTYATVILPELKKRYQVRSRSRRPDGQG